MENDPTSSPAEQRAVLVARLKRAASLPRMKDGRRPPMHVEGMSDGERIQPDGNSYPQPEPAQPPLDEGNAEPGSEQDDRTVEKPETPEPGPAGRKRRSRSRSRSRGSKDLRGKFKPPQSPVPPVTPSNDSSPDDSPSPRPLPNPSDAIVVSPIPSHIPVMIAPRLLMSPALLSPEYPGTSPPTPMLPSLEALQKGLFRSNSATARMMAMHKLTGGTETYDPFDSSPAATPPLPGKLNRNNTVAGGERHAARQALFQRLNGRIGGMDPGEVTSGSEEKEAFNTPTRKRVRRRSRRSSSNAAPRSTTDESEFSTSTNTPVMPPTPLPQPNEAPPPPVLNTHPPLQTSHAPSINLNDTLAGSRQATPIRLNSHELPPPRKRRSIIIEDQDDEERGPVHAGYPPPPPPRRFAPDQPPRPPQSSGAPSLTSTQSGLNDNDGLGALAYMSSRTPSRAPSRQQDLILSNPFSTPLKEKQSRDEDEDPYSEDEPNYSGVAYRDGMEREISWIADPVPESRMPINDDYDYDDEEEQENRDDDEEDENDIPAPESLKDEPTPQVEETSRPSSATRPIVVETELPLDTIHTHASPSPSSIAAFSNGAALARRSDGSDSPHIYPQRLSVASRIQSDRSPLSPDFEFEDTRAETPSKQGSSSTWEKFKNTLTRNGSTNGRRSRTNSIVTRERRPHTDSSVSRESGASITIPKNDGLVSLAPQQNPLMQSPSASTSALSLNPQTPPRSGVSPIPPASAVDLAKYQHAKLFPFPGMKKLEEQRNRARGMSLSSSTPDIVLSLGSEADPNTVPSSSSNTPSHSPEMTRDRKLSHQASDTRLLAKFKSLNSPPISIVPSSSSHPDYFSQGLSSAPATGSTPVRTLPTNVEGVRRWLTAKKLFPQPSTPSAAPSEELRQTQANKKPSLSDLLRGRKEQDLSSDWEEVRSDKASFTHTKSASTPFPKRVTENAELSSVSTSSSRREDSQRTPKASKVARPNGMDRKVSGSPAMTPSPIDQSPTPDPWSSISDYPPQTTSESSSTSSSQLSQTQLQGSVVLGRLDELLARGSKNPMWASVAEDASTRKLLVSSPVLQVVSSNTVKDRFLFLFSDLLIIAKPVTQGPDAFLELTKPNPSDRKFIVKNVVQRSRLMVSGEREDVQSKVASRRSTQTPALSAFIRQFSSDPDRAVGSILSQAGYRDDPVAVGDLLFRTLELDRAELGEYLSRRSSRAVLKHYIDSFGFSGLRVDKALRAFLMSIGIPSQGLSSSYTPFETLLESFASRWYEANAKNVAYDRDMANKLVRALIQLNEVLHGGISSEPGHSTYLRRNVTDRDFLEAFRRVDPRGLISDELVVDMYDSVRQERLSQATSRPNGSLLDNNVTFKRPLPPRLTYRIQSEPIVLRIPQPDPHFTIELYGQDLTFDPPVLSFTKSAEASFRITGASFGPKTIGMLRCGPNAVLYGGLPLSSPVEVERAFMRNTFQMAFLDHNEVKRKYMFSVPDPIMRNEWVVSLRRVNSPGYSSPSKFQAASTQLAFRVLQETLLPREALTNSLIPSKARDGKPGRVQSVKKAHDEQKMDLVAHLVRSKSRSRVYHRHGPGKAELQGIGNSDSAGAYPSDQGLDEDRDRETSGGLEERLWSGKDLEMICQQNSSIPLVLAYMQVGTPDRTNDGP